jgi:phosphatidylserine decarboxylase
VWTAADLFWHRNLCREDPVGVTSLIYSQHPLGLARAGLPEAFLYSLLFAGFCVLCAILALEVHALFWVPGVLFLALLLFVLSFFRDPERQIPADPQLLVSPADGTITDIGEVDEADFCGGRAYRVGIFLSVFNVHINRVPRSGQVIGLRYFPGRFLDARTANCGQVNEQLWIDVAEGTPGRFVRVKQIAGAIARRIVCWLRPGEEVTAGLRLGMIKFGSRTEVFIPVEALQEVLVKVGDKVQGGSTALLRMKPA